MNNFKNGDIVVCVNNKSDEFNNIFNSITLFKKYKIIKIIKSDGMVIIKNDKDKLLRYYSYRFISLNDYRKMKIYDIYEENI